MKKIMKSFIATLMMFILSFIGLAYAKPAFPSPTDNYVNDFADVLSGETEEKVRSIGAELEEKTTAELVVVLPESLEDMEIEDYANELFREWGIGQSDKNNGVLLIVAPNERRSRIEVGYGLEGRLPDGKTGQIQDEYLIPFLKEDDYDNGILNTYAALADEIAKEYDVQLTGLDGYRASHSQDEDSYEDIVASIVSIIVLLFLVDFIFFRGRTTRFLCREIFWSNIYGGRRGGRGGRGGGGFGGGGFGGFGGGGFGGGGFGGGSSGGGGSSRSW